MFIAAALIASLAISANALATPHLQGLRRHHQHLARALVPEPAQVAVPLAQPVANASTPRRQLRKRCKPRKQSSTSSTTLPSPSDPPAPVNVGSDPSKESSSPVQHAKSSSPSTSPSTPQSPSPTPKPSPQPASQPPPSPSQQPSPQPSSQPSQQPPALSDGETHTGEGTFYGTGLGACGITNSDSDHIVAVSEKLFDTFPGYDGVNPNLNPVCNKQIRATYQGKSVTVTVTDRCVACAYSDLDFSPSAFNELADPSVGRLFGVNWVWA